MSTELKINDRVCCVSNYKRQDELTTGKIYTIVGYPLDRNYVAVVNDKETVSSYVSKRFQKLGDKLKQEEGWQLMSSFKLEEYMVNLSKYRTINLEELKKRIDKLITIRKYGLDPEAIARNIEI